MDRSYSFRGMKKSFVITIAFVVGLLSVNGFCEGPFTVDKNKGEWTLFVIPDTQGYTEDWREEGYLYEEMVETFKWLGEVADDMNVQLVQSVGDMVENNNDVEWKRVVENYYPLMRKGIPTIPGAGNHEWIDGGGDGDFLYMNRYFPVSLFEDKYWWGGSFPKGKIQNSYQNFTISGQEYLFLTLQYNAGSPEVDAQDAVDWAEEIIKSNPDRIVVLSSHWNKNQPHFLQLVDQYPNVKITLAGHRCVEEYVLYKGRTHTFVQDYQCQGISKGPGGLMELRYFIFKPLEDKVEWYTYSAIANDGKGKFIERDKNSQGSFELVQKDPLRVE
jgi:hypothetical protein